MDELGFKRKERKNTIEIKTQYVVTMTRRNGTSSDLPEGRNTLSVEPGEREVTFKCLTEGKCRRERKLKSNESNFSSEIYFLVH